MNIILLQNLVSLLIIIPTYIKAKKWTNKWQISSQLQIEKWMKFLNYSQNVTCYNS